MKNNDPTPGRNQQLQSALGRYQLEVVRWNRQINLVSRQDTPTRTAELITQCRDAWRLLENKGLAHISTNEPLWYFDLGAGGGLPGFVWHLHLSQRWDQARTWLVEPREKRAWFLERLNSLAPDRPLAVVQARWGDAPVGAAVSTQSAPPAAILISLKALRLTDSEVLQGLSAAVAGVNPGWQAELVIARFCPPQQRLNRALAAELGFLSEPTRLGRLDCVPQGTEVLTPGRRSLSAAALAVSRYRVSG